MYLLQNHQGQVAISPTPPGLLSVSREKRSSMSRRAHGRIPADALPGEIPSFKLFESDKTLAFMDIQPLSKGHAVRDEFQPQQSTSRPVPAYSLHG